MRARRVVIRHPASGARSSSPSTSRRVVNAGDGAHEHPTQALLDASTRSGAQNGDSRRPQRSPSAATSHSRVARRTRRCYLLGSEVRLLRAAHAAARGARSARREVFDRVDERRRRRRHHDCCASSASGSGPRARPACASTPDTGLNSAPAAARPASCTGPINRGVEISGRPGRRARRSLDQAPGRRTAWPCGWRCSTTCSPSPPARSSRHEQIGAVAV